MYNKTNTNKIEKKELNTVKSSCAKGLTLTFCLKKKKLFRLTLKPSSVDNLLNFQTKTVHVKPLTHDINF